MLEFGMLHEHEIRPDEIADEWVKLGKGKLHFFLVHNGNVEEVLTNLKTL